MTPSPALVHFVVAATSSKSSSSSLLTLLPLLAIGVLGYFFFIRPQQKKAQKARQSQGSDIEVGDEVQTVGGVIGTVLEVHGDRYTLLTGALGEDGNLDGPQPTRIVFVRQAIARKIERIDDIRDVQVDDEPTDVRPSTNGSATKSTKDTSANGSAEDIDDVDGDNATSGGDRGGESEEA
jgi:preprotein translocase subunit YajC